MFSRWKWPVLCVIFLHVLSVVECEDYTVEIKNNGPVVRGATIRFTATLYHGNNLASGEFRYYWEDNAIPKHQHEIKSDKPVSIWDVKYDHKYPPGKYEVQVTVEKKIYLFYYAITSSRTQFIISGTLTGNLQVFQKNETRNNQFISTDTPLISSVKLSELDANFISNATSVTTFWFIDCIYYGPTNNAQFSHLFPTSDEEHTIDALMVADFHPPPPPTTTTTTTTTAKPTTVAYSTTVTKNPINISTTTVPTNSIPKQQTVNKTLKVKRSVEQGLNNTVSNKIQNIRINVNGTLQPYNGSFPYICNGTVAVDDVNAYGYFSRKIVAKDPISSVNVTGNNWLQHGDILALVVSCNGSPSLRYCVKFYRGSYNATGTESCRSYLTLGNCNFLIQRYLGDAEEHTVLLILENDVTKVVKTVAVTIYEVKKQAQLSVIVVPLAFSLVAIVAVVFGVAYYIQNRERFIVEVADFNFGTDFSDMEYKTFRERLQESFMNAFTRAPSPEASEAPNWPPGQSQKYDSMT
ncbi:uncharacterized protein LOC123309877 [Coccinella septempunctata]|uniref:uncharacterized protein LOC123309877 n=1 Tax=Coccinella septempunctata TaxID=41139 RepID=UPI001D095372|nr:uncharacterized protein LOC123309877 [Coccinella septempunctata]